PAPPRGASWGAGIPLANPNLTTTARAAAPVSVRTAPSAKQPPATQIQVGRRGGTAGAAGGAGAAGAGAAGGFRVNAFRQDGCGQVIVFPPQEAGTASSFWH